MTSWIVELGMEGFVAALDWVDLLEGQVEGLVDLVEGLVEWVEDSMDLVDY